MATRTPRRARRSDDEDLTSFEAELIGGLEEYVESLAVPGHEERGYKERLVILRIQPPSVEKDEVVGARRSLNASQELFAAILGVSRESVASWERGLTRPNPTARRLIDFIARDPGPWDRLLQKSVHDAMVDA